MSIRQSVTAMLAAPRATETVEVEGLGLVRVRVISAAELGVAAKQSRDFEAAGKLGHSLAAFVAPCLVDDDGSRPFDPTSAADLEILASLPHVALKAIEAAAIRINKLGPTDHETARKN